jgi:protein-S-isoprenylcysteine O-methyltransferase Ste14
MVPALGVCWGSFTARKTLVGTDLGTRPALIVLGVAALLLAGALAGARRKHLTQQILMGVPELSATDKGKLLTEGIYGRIRNPRYVELLTFILGVAAISNHLGLWILLLASMPAIELIVVLEERELRERFGAEFDEYCRRVPRWIPRSGKAANAGLDGPGWAQTETQGAEMGRQVAFVLYVVAMAAVIVGVDVVFFRNRFWERLTVNVGILLVFAAFYLRFLRHP